MTHIEEEEDISDQLDVIEILPVEEKAKIKNLNFLDLLSQIELEGSEWPVWPQGEKGDKWDDGYTPIKWVDYCDGKDWKDWKDGKDGEDGYTPVKGVDYFDGKDGENGLSAYEIAVKLWFEGTEEEWLKSLKLYDGRNLKPGGVGRHAINWLIPGGTTWQVIAKKSNQDYDLEWVNQSGGGWGGTWWSITGTLSDQTDLQAALDSKQALDADLTAIAGLSPSNDDFLQRKSGAWTNRSVAQVKSDLSLSGTNTGDQTSIVGITGTKAQFDTAVTDGNFLYVGDITQYTDEMAQDAVGAMVNSTLTYVDGTPSLGINLGNANTWTAKQTFSAAIDEAKGADIASATTTDIGAATGNFVHVTGTTTITGLGTIQAGTRRIVKFTGALTLTHNATSLILPWSANITTVAGDTATFVSLGSGNRICTNYQKVTWTGTWSQVLATNPVIVKPQTDAFFGATATYTPSASGTATLTCDTHNKHYITMPAGNITIALSNITTGQCILVGITQDGTGSRTVTWFSTIKRAGGTTPTLTTTASKRDVFGFICTGSGTYDGFIIWQNI